jgi:predicted metal-dependent hydrolase
MRQQLEEWAARIGVKPKRVQIQRMTTKWASCSTAGRICLSTELLSEAEPFREFVIVHELLHLMVPNHGKLFKSLMTAYMPDWEKRIEGRASGSCGSNNSGAGRGRE